MAKASRKSRQAKRRAGRRTKHRGGGAGQGGWAFTGASVMPGLGNAAVNQPLNSCLAAPRFGEISVNPTGLPGQFARGGGDPVVLPVPKYPIPPSAKPPAKGNVVYYTKWVNDYNAYLAANMTRAAAAAAATASVENERQLNAEAASYASESNAEIAQHHAEQEYAQQWMRQQDPDHMAQQEFAQAQAKRLMNEYDARTEAQIADDEEKAAQYNRNIEAGLTPQEIQKKQANQQPNKQNQQNPDSIVNASTGMPDYMAPYKADWDLIYHDNITLNEMSPADAADDATAQMKDRLAPQEGGRYGFDLTAQVAPATPFLGGIPQVMAIPCEGSYSNPMNPSTGAPIQPNLAQLGGANPADTAALYVPTAGYTQMPSTWTGRDGAGALLSIPYDARATPSMTPACLTTGGARRGHSKKRKHTKRKQVKRKHAKRKHATRKQAKRKHATRR